MRIPFSIGHGQFVMNDASIKGPLVGATLRGKVDFRSQRHRRRRHLRAPLGSQQRAGSHSPDRPGADRPRRRGHLRHHLCHSGQASPARQVIVNPFALVTPGYPPRDHAAHARGPARACRARNRPRAMIRPPRALSSSAAKSSGGGFRDPGVTPDIGAGWSAEASDGAPRRSRSFHDVGISITPTARLFCCAACERARELLICAQPAAERRSARGCHPARFNPRRTQMASFTRTATRRVARHRQGRQGQHRPRRAACCPPRPTASTRASATPRAPTPRSCWPPRTPAASRWRSPSR